MKECGVLWAATRVTLSRRPLKALNASRKRNMPICSSRPQTSICDSGTAISCRLAACSTRKATASALHRAPSGATRSRTPYSSCRRAATCMSSTRDGGRSRTRRTSAATRPTTKRTRRSFTLKTWSACSLWSRSDCWSRLSLPYLSSYGSPSRPRIHRLIIFTWKFALLFFQIYYFKLYSTQMPFGRRFKASFKEIVQHFFHPEFKNHFPKIKLDHLCDNKELVNSRSRRHDKKESKRKSYHSESYDWAFYIEH